MNGKAAHDLRDDSHRVRSHQSQRPICCVSIDVESDWGGRASPVEAGIVGCRNSIPWILALFDRLGVRSTFFVSAEVAPLLTSELRDITSRGHEIASHGQRHIRYDRLPLCDLEEELQISKATLENQTGRRIAGFRSPYFIVHRGLFPALAQAGYEYDSSLVAGCLPGRYNNKISDSPFWKDGVLEIPICRLPFTPLPNGLLWLVLLRCFLRIAHPPSPPKPVQVLYLHPFDLYRAKYTPRIEWKVNLWYLLGQKRSCRILESHLQQVARRSEFSTMRDLFTQHRSRS